MKTLFIALSFVVLTGCATQSTIAQSGESHSESRSIAKQKRAMEKEIATAYRQEEVKSILESGSYKIAIQKAFSTYLSRPFNDITEYYYLKVTPVEFESFLPYFGKVHLNPQRGRISPLDFSSRDFEVKTLKSFAQGDNAQEVKIDIVGSTTNLRYEYFIKIFDNGNVTVNMSCPSLQSMQFMGELVGLE